MVSSQNEILTEFRHWAKQYRKVSSVITQSSLGFHTSYLSGVKNDFREYLKDTEINKPEYAIVSNVDAKLMLNPEKIKSNLVSHFDSTVLVEKSFYSCLEYWGVNSQSTESSEIEVVDVGSSGFMSKCVKESLIDEKRVEELSITFSRVESSPPN